MRIETASLAVLGGLCVLLAHGAVAEEAARALLDRVRHLNEAERHWTDRRQNMKLEIVDRRGGVRHRELEVLTKRYGDGVSRSILFFHAPAPIRGTGLLQWIDSGKPDRQWLYLPALKRVRQITGATKRESFVGTDFSFEDLAIITEIVDWNEEDAASSLRGDETLDGHSCAVIEFVPRGKDVGYARIRLWLDREELVSRKIELESTEGKVEKTLLLSEIRAVGSIPSPYRMEMRNEHTQGRTVVEFVEIRYDVGLDDDTFTQRRLERGV